MEEREDTAYLGEVLTRVGATGLLAGGSAGDGLYGALEEVAELEGLNEVAVAGYMRVFEYGGS